MKLIIFFSVALLYVTVVLARSTDDSYKRNHEKQDLHVGKRHHDKARHKQHISTKHSDHKSQVRHSQHRHGSDGSPNESSPTPFDVVSTTASYADYSQVDVSPPGPSKRHRGGRMGDMSMRGKSAMSSRKSMKRDSQNIFESIGSLLTCLPQIFANIPNILLKELSEPPMQNRTLQLTVNGQIVYSIILNPQLSICANPNYDGCQILSDIVNISSNVLPNFGPDFNNRVSCVRQIMCNVTQAIVTDLNTLGFFSRREFILKLDDNVIFRFVTGLLPSCDVGNTTTARHHAIGSEKRNRIQKKHSKYPKTKRASDYAGNDQSYEPDNDSSLDDAAEDPDADIQLDQ